TFPLLSIFRAYTLYRTEGCREGRSWYSLRVGFFADAISAKQVASYVRSSFPSVAVVPITEEERANAANSRIDTTTLSDTFGQQSDHALATDRAQQAAGAAGSAPTGSVQAPPVKSPVPVAAVGAGTQRATSNDRSSSAKRDRGGKESLEQTLELLASSDIWE